MGLLKIISRSSNRTSKHADHDWPDDEEDPLALPNTPFISRPPPLDVRTEQDLRRACAIILADLKPSGYDIEDTRMKSDVLVDARERDGGSYRQHLQPPKLRAQGPAPATDTITALPPPTARPRRDYDEQTRVDEVRLSSNTQAQIASLMAPLEAPLAPAPTTIASPPPPRSAAARRGDSIASTASTNATSRSAAASTGFASTGFASTNATSTLPSNRVSDMAAIHTDKQLPLRSHELTLSPVVTTKLSAPEAPPRTSALSPRSDTRPGSKRGYSVSSIHSQRAESVYSESGRESRNPSDAGLGGVPPLRIDRDAPPVPRLDRAGVAAARPLTKPESSTTSRPQTATRQPSHGILKHHKESSIAQDVWKSPAPGRADGSRTDPRAGDFDSLMPSTKTAQAQQPPTVASSSREAGVGVSSPSRASMSSMRSRGPQINIPSRTSSMTAQTQAPNGIGRPSISAASQVASGRAGSIVSLQQRSALSGLENGMAPVAHRTVTAQAKASEGPNGTASPRSPVDIVYHGASPDMMQGGRLSQTGSMRTGLGFNDLPRERRGFMKFMSKLGGGEMQERKLYVSPSYHAHNDHMQAGYPDDYWSDDDEVCAAPVVAFGRGW